MYTLFYILLCDQHERRLSFWSYCCAV